MSPHGEKAAGSIDEFLRALNSALRVGQLYPRGHSSIVAALARAEDELALLLRLRPTVNLGTLGEEIVFDDGKTYPISTAAGALLRVLQAHGIDRITMAQGCSAADLNELLDILQQSPEDIAAVGGAQRALQTRGVRAITLERLTPTPLQPKDVSAPQLPEFSPLQSRLLVQARAGVEALVDSIEGHRPIIADSAREYAYDLTRALVEGESPVLSLALMGGHEERWLMHLVRVTALATAYGRHLGLDPGAMQSMTTAAFLYDVGLLALGLRRDSAPENTALYRAHPVEGARLLLAGKNVDRLSVVVAFEHHMLHDQSGYPCVAGKQLVHPAAELVGLADEFVDLVSDRETRRGLRPDQAILRLSSAAGKAYDGRLFAAFVETVGVFAPGTFVDLSDGRYAVVMKTNPLHVLRPLVRVIADEAGRILDRPSSLDLAACTHISILGAFDPRERGIDPGGFVRPLMAGR